MIKKIEKNNVAIALKVLYAKKEKIYLAYVSKSNLNSEKQVIRLMIPNGKGWHYLAVKTLWALLRGITSKNKGDFHCLNSFHSFRRKSNFETHKKVCENKDFCNIIMTSEDTKILEFNQDQKSDKGPSIIHADLECLIKKIGGCKNDPENLFTTKVVEHVPWKQQKSFEDTKICCICKQKFENKYVKD